MFGDVDGMVQAFENGRMSRRELVAGLGTMFAAWAGLTRPASAKEDAVGSNSTFEAVGLNHIALRVTDIPCSREFYKKHLGMTVRSESERNCFMNCGRHWIAMFRGDVSLSFIPYSLSGERCLHATRERARFLVALWGRAGTNCSEFGER